MVEFIKPRQLPPVVTVSPTGAIPIDNGSEVQRATPAQIVETGRPIATEAEALAGTDNSKAMTPLRVMQAVVGSTSGAVAEARAWAESPSNPDPLDPDSKSSKTWAGEASDAAAAAATSEGNAGDSATAAAASAASILDLPLMRYDAQALTEPEQSQARANIGVPVQTQAVWNAGTSTAESLVSPSKLKATIDARNIVSYSAQTLTSAQKDQVKANIEAVSYAAQTLTTAQQDQARANIAANVLGAGSGWGFTSYSSVALNTTYTNTTGYPILVFARANFTPLTDLVVEVDGDPRGRVFQASSSESRMMYLDAYVPDGATWRYAATSAPSSINESRYRKA